MEVCIQNNKNAAHEYYYSFAAFHCESQVIFVKICVFILSRRNKNYYHFLPPFVYSLWSDIRNIPFSRRLPFARKKKENKTKRSSRSSAFCWICREKRTSKWKRWRTSWLAKQRLGKTISFDAQDLLVCISVSRWMILRPRICRRLWRYFYLSIRNFNSSSYGIAHAKCMRRVSSATAVTYCLHNFTVWPIEESKWRIIF